MAVAEIIGSAVGVLLLVIVAYLLVGGTLSTAETVVAAQKDITLLQEARLGTKIEISEISTNVDGLLNFSISNTGTTSITDLEHMDIMLYDSTVGYTNYKYVKNFAVPPESLDPNLLQEYRWTDVTYINDNIHSRQLDPGTTMTVEVKLPANAERPTNLQVITSNGISATSII